MQTEKGSDAEKKLHVILPDRFVDGEWGETST